MEYPRGNRIFLFGAMVSYMKYSLSKSIAFLCFFSFSFAFCLPVCANGGTNQIAFYFLNSDISCDTIDNHRVQLDRLKTEGEPFFSDLDFLDWDVTNCCFSVSQNSGCRYFQLLAGARRCRSGIPFCLEVSNQPIYVGVIVTEGSSFTSSNPGLSIDADTRHLLSLGKTNINLRFKIERAVPDESFALGPDHRYDQRIKDAVVELLENRKSRPSFISNSQPSSLGTWNSTNAPKSKTNSK